jgi:nitroreductase
MLENLVMKSRSCRRFYENEKISTEDLQELVNFARLSPSASNLQPLKYILSYTAEKNKRIFPHLSWAAYLTQWAGPAEGERPAAYIIILGDTSIVKSFNCDHGIAAQSILLGACEKGLRGCIIGSINRQALHKDLDIDISYKILLVIALGKPKEEVKIENTREDGDIRYWRDTDGVHHVPKRKLEDIILSE